MSAEPFDADDWAKEDCDCGHRRYMHKNGTGPCTWTKPIRLVVAQGEYICGCPQFYYYEPSIEPDDRP